jgi:hypothetical protein
LSSWTEAWGALRGFRGFRAIPIKARARTTKRHLRDTPEVAEIWPKILVNTVGFLLVAAVCGKIGLI